MRKKRRWDEEFCKMCEKKGILRKKLGRFAVAPYAGAWIEIPILGKKLRAFQRRSLRGSVD